jgi:lipid-A-disaccharide synthase
MAPRIGLVAGETSGDQLGAGLIAALRERFPDAEFAGIGGDRMREAGLDAWHDASELAVMGLAEVLAHLPRLLRVRRQLRERMLAWKPDVFVGIDAPDFNLGVERWLKQRGVRTVHDVSPSVWAWRESRAEKIGRSADRVLCLFPMEPPIYARHGIDARYIGHPLADALPLEPDRNQAREALGIGLDERVLAILPGSRLGEIHRLGRVFFDAAALVAKALPGVHVVVPAANAACRQAIEAMRPDGVANLHVLDGQAQRAMIASDAVLLASGTAALEAMLCKRPMVVGYRLAPLSHAIVRTFGLLKVEHVSLPNVLAGEALVPELLQDACTPERLAAALLPFLRSPEAGLLLQPRFRELHLALRRDASARAADAIAELLAEEGHSREGADPLRT